MAFQQEYAMRRSDLYLLCAVLCLGNASCSDDDNQQADTGVWLDGTVDSAAQLDAAGQHDAQTQPDASVTLACDGLTEGVNSNFMVDGTARTFMLNLPTGAETGGPYAVIFSYHGLGDNIQNFAGLMSSQVNHAEMPFILVTPDDTDHQMYGINADWNAYNVTDPETNVEVRLFDEVLACLEQRWGVDENHVHTTGFSIGGGVADLLGVFRGAQIASIATWSGAYLSNQNNVNTLGMLSGQVHWNAPTHTNHYTQLFIHGGTTDDYNMTVTTLEFDVFANNDITYLGDMGHDTIICNHGNGHSCPSTVSPALVVQFFADHPLGTTDSPYGSALPSGFPAGCTFQAAP